MTNNLENNFFQGLQDSIPVGLGYLSVSFTFGIMCISANIPLEVAVTISLTNLTSAGQFSGLSLIIEQAPLIEVAISQCIINLRYALMSLSLTQKIDPKINSLERALLSYGITDEIFALASSKQKKVGKYYMAGLIIFPVLCWTLGTFIGGFATSLLPNSIRNALGIAIYGMFLAIIIPPSKQNINIRKVIILSITISTILYYLKISSGFSIIICTIIAATLGAILFPIQEDD